ncbi:PSD1 and planctomycete cytochrome C domain-containing protein [Rubripirellula lacrimiformis]|uniref:PSD1 and planctomycete cytochrome C domain-containing protein n=1 Tax=Rubripirellula lacrimiformis TaxID=1930273 RepID=UPI001C54E5BD|nr:PSD1 and planctomycete cytochrome C domain-containing protein [Rubripirellula lacrimiformis]
MKHPTAAACLASFLFTAGWIATACPSAIAEPTTSATDEHLRFFESRIRPLLIRRCYECHSGEDREGGLRLDTANSLTAGGDSGPAAIAGDPDASLLVAAIRYDGLEMPPDEPLSATEKGDIERWIRDGAAWPIQTEAGHGETDLDDAPWWAAEPITRPVVPAPVPGVDSPTAIDRFIDAQLDAQGLHRAPHTDRRSLIRRLSYDLLGVPPSPDAIRQFVQDRRPNAYARLVESMFADPAYGTRMGRLWLDLVRYAESDGYRADAYRPQAWRYRDFVVDAFNSKMPYDEFVQLQIAGDEIAPNDDRALAAAGFLRLGIFEYNQRDAEGQWEVIVDEMTDVTADVFLSTGLACAKCHDHKFDPIPRSDYFRFRSVFEPVLFVDRQQPPPPSREVQSLLDELRAVESDTLEKMGEAQVDRFPEEVQAAYRKPAANRNSYEHQLHYIVARQVVEEALQDGKIKSALGKERYERRAEILRQLDQRDANPYAPADLISVVDAEGEIRPTRLPGRSQGKQFSPGVPEIFGGQDLAPTPPIDAPSSTGRRSALARWITDAHNPITPRVMVNRLWQYHFGQGLATSPNDFGRLGQPPSHPELLDHLANRLVDSGWSIEAIQRELVTSATYQQSAIHPDAESALAIDASNRLHWHRTVRRLDAEQYRDTLLVAMDNLIDQMNGPGPSGTQGRRSIYIRRYRNRTDEMLGALDAPPGIVGTAKRDVTTTAPQSLMMLNNARILHTAAQFASRVRKDVQTPQSGSSDGVIADDFAEQFIDRAHQILTGSPADPVTIELLGPLVTSGETGQVDACHVLLNSNAFLFVE